MVSLKKQKPCRSFIGSARHPANVAWWRPSKSHVPTPDNGVVPKIYGGPEASSRRRAMPVFSGAIRHVGSNPSRQDTIVLSA